MHIKKIFKPTKCVYKIKRVIACSECDISLTYLLKHNPVHKIKRITKSHLGNRNKLERPIKPYCRGANASIYMHIIPHHKTSKST